MMPRLSAPCLLTVAFSLAGSDRALAHAFTFTKIVDSNA